MKTETPLSRHALDVLGAACTAPIPRHQVNPGVIWKLEFVKTAALGSQRRGA